jgi:hypothetical protein
VAGGVDGSLPAHPLGLVDEPLHLQARLVGEARVSTDIPDPEAHLEKADGVAIAEVEVAEAAGHERRHHGQLGRETGGVGRPAHPPGDLFGRGVVARVRQSRDMRAGAGRRDPEEERRVPDVREPAAAVLALPQLDAHVPAHDPADLGTGRDAPGAAARRRAGEHPAAPGVRQQRYVLQPARRAGARQGPGLRRPHDLAGMGGT